MDDFLRLLSVEGVTPVGMALGGFCAFVLSLWREWLVTGKRWEAKLGECATCTTALQVATMELRDSRAAHVETRIALARIEEREDLAWGTKPTRRSRQGPGA